MGPGRDNDKARSINEWLEGVNMAASVRSEGNRKVKSSKQRPKRRPQHQPDNLSPAYSSKPPPPSTSAMGRPDLRERNPKRAPPAETPSEERPPAKRRRKPANTGDDVSIPATQPRSVQFSEESGSRGGSSYDTSYSNSLNNRTQRGNLQAAEPEVIFAALDTQEEKPNEVYEIMKRLVDRLDNAIPASLKHRLTTQQTSNNLERDNEATQADLRLWDRVEEIIEKANESLEIHADENRWTRLVDPFIESVLGGRDTLFTVQPVHPLLELSQSDDESIRHLCHLAAIETKSPDGSYYDATIQLAIWLAASFEKIRQLRELAITGVPSTVSASTSGDEVDGAAVDKSSDSASLPLPNIGIAVVGHAWYLHLAVKEADGAVVIYGPRLIGDTSDRSGIFRILSALEAIRSWGEEVYYPWLRSHVLMPLAGVTARS